MRSRRLYRSLLRLHPRHFREQFEEELMSIFDEVTVRRGSAPMLLDILSSVIRQWVLRSAHWRRAGRLEIEALGTMAPEEIRRRSQQLHRSAWRANLAWGMASLALITSLSTWKSGEMHIIGLLFLGAGILYGCLRHQRGVVGRRDPAALSLFFDQQRTLLERKRTGLQGWAGDASLGWSGRIGPVMVLVFLMASPLAAPILTWVRTGALHPNVGVVHFAVGLGGLTLLSLLWYLAADLNSRAIQALQLELRLPDADKRSRARQESGR